MEKVCNLASELSVSSESLAGYLSDTDDIKRIPSVPEKYRQYSNDSEVRGYTYILTLFPCFLNT